MWGGATVGRVAGLDDPPAGLVTRRKPLEWYASTDGSGRQFPACDTCADRLLAPFFAEAVYSVSIENGGDPVAMARSTIDAYHARRHVDP